MTDTAHNRKPLGFNLTATLVKILLLIILKEVFEHIEEKPGEVTDNVDDDDGGEGEGEDRMRISSSQYSETICLHQYQIKICQGMFSFAF